MDKRKLLILVNPRRLLASLAYRGYCKWMPDAWYLRLIFKYAVGYKLCLSNPRTFNEKLQWLKLYDRNPAYTQMVDKYKVRKYITDKIGKEYLIPLLGVWDKPEDIDFNILPNQFVLKCTHDSGTVIICKDKSKFDIGDAKNKLKKYLKRNFYYGGREWPYKNVKPRIIAEKYMVDESGYELKDYKIFNFNGKAKIISVDFDRFIKHKRNLYTTDWNFVEAQIQYPADGSIYIDKPKELKKMLELATILSAGIPHVRTDFYSINDRIFFGELTFYNGSGFSRFNPKSFGEEMGKWISLPNVRGGGC